MTKNIATLPKTNRKIKVYQVLQDATTTRNLALKKKIPHPIKTKTKTKTPKIKLPKKTMRRLLILLNPPLNPVMLAMKLSN